MNVEIIVTNGHRRYKLSKSIAGGYIRRVLTKEGRRKASVSLVFVDSAFIRTLNRRYLRHNYITDVLAFPFTDSDALDGEIYVNVDRARQQARAQRVRFGEELARLVIHGTLHLAGYDDSKPSLARVMRREEDRHVSYWFDKRRGEG